MLQFSIYCADGVVFDVAESDDASVSNLLGRFGSVQRARIVPGTDGRRGCTFTQLRTLNRPTYWLSYRNLETSVWCFSRRYATLHWGSTMAT